MKNKTTVWSLRGVGISLMLALFATGVYSSQNTITQDEANTLKNFLYPPRTQTKASLTKLVRGVKQQMAAQTAQSKQKQRTAQRAKQQIQSDPAYKALTNNLRTTIEDTNRPALIYCINNGSKNLALTVSPVSSRSVNTDQSDEFMSLLFSQAHSGNGKKVGRDLKNIILNIDQQACNGAYILLHRGLPKSLKMVFQKEQGLLILPTQKGCLLFDIAKVVTGKITINTSEQKEAEALRKNFTALLDSMLSKINFCRNDTRRQNLRESIDNFYNTNQNPGDAAVIHLILNKLCERAYKENASPHDRLQLDEFLSHMPEARVFDWLLNPQTGGMQFLVGACKGTKLDFVYKYLRLFVSTLRASTLTAMQKMARMNQFSANISLSYNMHNPKKPQETRTAMHCILRNADGSYSKKLEYAARENTVRALLMLIVAGANATQVDAFYTPVWEIPFRSYRYLASNGTATQTGANFSFVGKKAMFVRQTQQAPPIRNHTIPNWDIQQDRLTKMCHLCSFVIGAAGEHDQQATNIKQSLLGLTAAQTPAPLNDIDDYLTELETVLDRIKIQPIAQLLNFASTHRNFTGNPLVDCQCQAEIRNLDTLREYLVATTDPILL